MEICHGSCVYLGQCAKMAVDYYMILSVGFAAYCYYDGWVSEKYLKDPSNLWFNRVAAVVLVVVFVVLIIRFFGILKTRVVADESGIDVDGRIKIAWQDLARIDNTHEAKGLVDLYYTHEGQEKKWIADNYKINHFDELLDEISAHRPDLLAPVEEEKEQK